MENNKNYIIGFIGQGFVGKNQADDFERRGYTVIRYSLDESFIKNKEKIKECDIVFIAVPTPTTPTGFDYSIVKKVMPLIGKGKIAVIKSTVLPGVTEIIQNEWPEIFVLHSPEFLSESTAARDSAFPDRNIVGIPIENFDYIEKAKEVMSVLPNAPYNKICSATEACIIKYGRNCAGFVRIIFTNILYDLTTSVGARWETIEEAMGADPDNGRTYMKAIHKSGRGAGGHCFIKDFSAFRSYFENNVNDSLGLNVLKMIEEKNIELLKKSNKDLDLLNGVYAAKMPVSRELHKSAVSK